MISNPLQLGILGLGEGVSILSAACHSDLATPHTICDLDESLCRQRSDEFKIPRFTTRYQEMLDDPEVECIAIYTPDHLHAEHAIAALQAGKHVICTKPLIKGLAGGARLLAAQQQSSRQLLVGQSCRFFPTFQRQRDEFAGIGELISAEAHYHGDKRKGTSGRWGKSGAVNWLYTGLVHPTDLVYWHLGDIEEVTGFCAFSPAARQQGQQSPDTFHFSLKAKSGAIGRVSGCYGSPHAHPQAEPVIGCVLRGSQGVTHASYPDFNYYSHSDAHGSRSVNESRLHAYYFRWGGSRHHAGEFQNYLEYFARCLRSGEMARPNLNDGLKVIATLEAMARSAQTGQSVQPGSLLEEHGLAQIIKHPS